MIATRNGYLALGVLLVCFGAALAAQNRTGAATLDDLLSEIRGLRTDIAMSSNAALRTQMLVARIQIQEQRVNTTFRQLTEAQNEMAGVKQMVAANEGPLRQAEHEVQSTVGNDRVAAELALADIKQRLGPVLAQFHQRAQELAARQNELLNQLSADQMRWNDFNDSLDALERSLQTR
jgi:hypothetical protein